MSRDSLYALFSIPGCAIGLAFGYYVVGPWIDRMRGKR